MLGLAATVGVTPATPTLAAVARGAGAAAALGAFVAVPAAALAASSAAATAALALATAARSLGFAVLEVWDSLRLLQPASAAIPTAAHNTSDRRAPICVSSGLTSSGHAPMDRRIVPEACVAAQAVANELLAAKQRRYGLMPPQNGSAIRCRRSNAILLQRQGSAPSEVSSSNRSALRVTPRVSYPLSASSSSSSASTIAVGPATVL